MTKQENEELNKQLQAIANGTAPKPKELSFWGKTKKSASKAIDEIAQPLKQGLQNVADFVSPVETNFSELPSLNDAIDEKLSVDENDVGFRVYRRIGELAKLKEGFTDPSKEDIDQYNQNLKKLVVEDLGYDGLGFDSGTGKYFVIKDGKESDLDPTTFQTIVGEVLGDKAEIYGAMAGAKAGSKIGGGAKMKLLGAIGGGAIGAGLGSIVDTTASVLSTGQELSAKQFANEIAKSAVLDATGAVVAGGAIKIAGKALHLPKDVWNLVANGNIDGAKKILKSDLKLSDDAIDEALAQMKQSEVEQYGDGLLGGVEAKQEELVASTMSHPQGERIIKEAVADNPKAGFELEQSIDKRAKGVLDSTNGVSGTEIKQAVEGYESRVKKQYSDMRSDVKEAFSESDYRFDLDSLKLDDTLDELSARVTDPVAKQKFEGMVGAIKNIVQNSKNGIGVEKDIDSLLDIRQMMNSFYRKNEKALALASDKKTFSKMIDSIDSEIGSAMDKLESPELKKGLLDSFDNARTAYKEMYDTQDSALYKTLMGEGKSADERVKALLKHTTDDADEFQSLLNKLTPEEATKVEETIVNSVLKKNTIGKANEMQSIDYATVVDEFTKLRPFIKNDFTKQSMQLVEDMYRKYQHDFNLAKVVKGITPDNPSGGIATSAEGRMKSAGAKRIFDFIQTMIPFSDNAKRLALQRHIGKALERSRTPVEMARTLAFNPAVPNRSRQALKQLIKANNAILRAKTQQAQQEAVKELEAVSQKIEAQNVARQKAIEEFKTPPIEELNSVQRLTPDSGRGVMARTIRSIQEGKATPADIERYIDAKEAIEPSKFQKYLDKEKIVRLHAKYKDVGEEQIRELEQLRDYMMSNPNMKFGHEVHPKQFKFLLYDLRTKGVPRSLKYDELYDTLRGMYDELGEDIQRAYSGGSNDTLDDFGNPLFGGVATVGAVGLASEASQADDTLDKLVGLEDGLFDEKIVIKRLNELDNAIASLKGGHKTIPTENKVKIAELEKQRDTIEELLPKAYSSNNKPIKDIIAHIESRGDYNAKNPKSSASGKYQFMAKIEDYISKKTGLSKEFLSTPKGQEYAMDILLRENKKVLEKRGIPINSFTLYGSHQLGATGFSRVFRGKPTTKDITNMKNNLPKKLTKNISKKDIPKVWVRYYREKVANA